MRVSSIGFVLAISVGFAAAAQPQRTCISLEDCGEPVDFPYYYDWLYSPASMYTVTRLALLNGFLMPTMYIFKKRAWYRQTSGREASIEYLFDDEVPSDPWLKGLRRASLVHMSLWGTATLLNFAGMSGILPSLAVFWLEHMVSNFAWVFNGYVIYVLVDAGFSAGSVTLYVIGALVFWAMTAFSGTGALKALDRDYPYNDFFLLPSILYLLGILHHTESYPFEDIEWPQDQESLDEAEAIQADSTEATDEKAEALE